MKRGGYVAVLDLNEELGQRVEMELKEVTLFVRCDVRSEEDVVRTIKEVDLKWGTKGVGGLVHCGGVGMAGKVRPFLPATQEWGRGADLGS